MNNRDNNSDKQNSPERNLSSNAANEPTPIYLNEDSTLQTPEEYQHDKSMDPTGDNTMEASNDDLHDPNANRITKSGGTDTNERKLS